jgi:hypothetical protein
VALLRRPSGNGNRHDSAIAIRNGIDLWGSIREREGDGKMEGDEGEGEVMAEKE